MGILLVLCMKFCSFLLLKVFVVVMALVMKNY